jgi:hypothetical protein
MTKLRELTVAELNDAYLRDTHVKGLNKPRIALEKAIKAWDDVDLTGQTNLECARNWFIEGYVQAIEFPTNMVTVPLESVVKDSLTAQKEDLLLDLYKLNAYIPNDGEGNTLTPFGNFAEGYRVGQAEQANTIAQLQLDNTKLREDIVKVKDVFLTGFGTPQQRIDKCLGILSLSTTSQPESQPESTVRNYRTTQKDEALRMAIETLEYLIRKGEPELIRTLLVCKEALSQPVVKESLTTQKPLSDEEIFSLCPYSDEVSEEAFYRGARAIEKRIRTRE